MTQTGMKIHTRYPTMKVKMTPVEFRVPAFKDRWPPFPSIRGRKARAGLLASGLEKASDHYTIPMAIILPGRQTGLLSSDPSKIC